jgi:hypothetical protein
VFEGTDEAEVERAFRTMKSKLDLRPVLHRRDERVRAHVLLWWLGLLLVRVIETESGMTWDRIREAMDEVSLTSLLPKHGRVEIVSNLNDDQRDLLKSLNLSPPKRVRSFAATPANPSTSPVLRPLGSPLSTGNLRLPRVYSCRTPGLVPGVKTGYGEHVPQKLH